MRRLTVCLAVVGVVTTFGMSSALAGDDLKPFCKTYVAVDSGKAGDKQLQKLRDTAPPEIADAVNTAVDLFEELGEDAFEDETFIAAIEEINQFVFDNCGYEVIDVAMTEYAFDGIPTEIEKGTVAFNVTNEGAELHEIHFIRLKGDATLDDILELPEDAEEHEFEEFGTEVAGEAFAFPGETDAAFIKFKKPGNYVALCSIPVGTTPETVEAEESGGEHEDEGGGGAPHFKEGMAAEFEVTS